MEEQVDGWRTDKQEPEEEDGGAGGWVEENKQEQEEEEDGGGGGWVKEDGQAVAGETGGGGGGWVEDDRQQQQKEDGWRNRNRRQRRRMHSTYCSIARSRMWHTERVTGSSSQSFMDHCD